MTDSRECADTVRLIPLGGFGEIGKNMLLVECREQILLVDAGIAFPDAEAQLGVDLLIPNFSYLRANAHRLVGIVLTHGHEDHIGGLPYLLRELRAPVYGGALTLGLVRAKLGAFHLDEPDLHVVAAGDRLPIGCFEVEFVHVNHSIPDTFSLAIRTPGGTLFHSGDFKFDHTPIDGRPTDFSALARIGDEGVLALISDSTNIHRPGHTPSEALVGQAFTRLFPRATGRLVIASFASQIHRIQQVLDTAARFGKKVLVAGRNMERNVNVARELGYLTLPEGVRIGYADLVDYRDDELVVLITGAQGEPISGLTRMANGSHPKLRLHPDDTVIFSATPIPGNETAIWAVINELLRGGARVITHREEQVHVSGHASSEETKLLFNLIRPRYAVPGHGEYRHMAAYGELAQDLGLSHRDIFLLHNGDVLSFGADGPAVGPPIAHGVWTIDGRRVNELGTSDQVMQDRRFLAESGVITASVVWDFARGDFAAAPVVGVRGVRAGHGLDEAALLAGAVQRVEERLTHLEPEARAQRVELERAGKRALRSWFEKATGTYPVLQFLLVGLHEPAVATVADGEEAETAASVVLTVDGEVERRLELSLVDLGRLQPVDANAGAEETALPLRVLCEAAGLRPHASHLTVANERDGRSVSLPLAAILDHALLVYGIVDQPLAEEDGGPVRFAAPGEDGATVPQVSRLTATFGAR